MSLVLDASATLPWYFEGEATAATEALLDRVAEDGAVVPPLWRIEVANAFRSAMLRGRFGPGWRDASLADLAAMPIAVDPEADRHVWSTTLGLSDRFGLTLYDATCLELARRRGLPLATLDRALGSAAWSLGLPVFGAPH